MSQEIVKKIVQRTKTDAQFLQALLTNPDETLKQYNLTEAERQFFRQSDQKTLEGLSDSCFELTNKTKKK